MCSRPLLSMSGADLFVGAERTSARAMEPGVLLLLGITVAFARGTSSLGADVPRSGRARAQQQRSELAPRSAADTRGRPGQQGREAACPGCGAPKPPKRARRCTCSSYKDKECVYYCHLDIIWINTPERTVPYGVSSYRGLQRVRRSSGGMDSTPQCLEPQRCSCRYPADSECSSFCKARPLEPVDQVDSTPGQCTSVQTYPPFSTFLRPGSVPLSFHLWP